MQALKGEEYNEITVEEEGSVVDYAQYCHSLLTVSLKRFFLAFPFLSVSLLPAL